MWESLDIIQREYGGQSELFTRRLSFLWLLRFLILSRGPCQSFSNVVLALKTTQPALRGTGTIPGASLYTVTGRHLINVHRNHCICSKLRTQQSLSQRVRCRGLPLLWCSSRKRPPSSSRTSVDGIRTQVCDESEQTLTLPVLHPSCMCVCVRVWLNKRWVTCWGEMKWLLSSSVSEGVGKKGEKEKIQEDEGRGREADDEQVSLTLNINTLTSSF